MTDMLAIWLVLLAAAALALALLIVAWIVRDGGDDPDGWESGHLDQLDAMLDDGYDPADYDDQLESDLQADAEEHDRPQLAAIAARPYVPYLPRHADDTIEFHLVPDDWHPTIGARRIAASLDSTAQMQVVTP